MIIRIEDFKDVCKKILTAVDSHELSVVTETLEMVTKGKTLFINVTNREYFAQVKLDLDEEIPFHATVSANLFLSLISQITTDTVELFTKDNALVVKGNGTYKLPLIFEGENLLQLPEITIKNPTVDMTVDGEILQGILNYNSKELEKATAAQLVQRFYYVDEKGAITFTSGACVNSFTLEKPIKVLLNNRLVKLFKLFKAEKVHLTLGYDAVSDSSDVIQTKIRFESSSVILTAILSCDETLVNAVPVDAIRDMATMTYDYSVTINKDELLQTINRLLLFSSKLSGKEDIKPYSKFEFDVNSVTIYDSNGDNKEKVNYSNDSVAGTYETILDLVDLKKTLESYDNQFVNINFGNGQAVVLTRPHVYTVVPEIN